MIVNKTQPCPPPAELDTQRHLHSRVACSEHGAIWECGAPPGPPSGTMDALPEEETSKQWRWEATAEVFRI